MVAGKFDGNRKTSRRLLTAVVLLTQLFVPTFVWASDECEWQFTMHQHETGDFNVAMGRHNVKISSDSGLVGLANGPNWEVVRYRALEKIEWRAKMSEIWGLNVHMQIPKPDEIDMKSQWSKRGTGEKGGIACSRWVLKCQPERVFWLAEDMPVDPQVIELMCRTFRVPITPRLPVYVRRPTYVPVPRAGAQALRGPWSLTSDLAELEDDSSVELAASAFKKVPFNKADFLEPKGFKRVRTSGELVLSKQQSDQLVEMLDGIGFASGKEKTANHNSKLNSNSTPTSNHSSSSSSSSGLSPSPSKRDR